MNEPQEAAIPSHAEARKSFLKAFGSLSGINANENQLVDDLFALQIAFQDPAQYQIALRQILERLRRLQSASLRRRLKHRLRDWRRYAFASTCPSELEYDLRIVCWRQEEGAVELLGFGRRTLPSDVYHRLTRRLTPRRK